MRVALPLAGGALLYGGLGCTKFSSDLIAKVPDLISTIPNHDWRTLDWQILARLEGHLNGVKSDVTFERHYHEPPVSHHHSRPWRNKQGLKCDCGFDGRH